jgi:hypothetical protein
MPRTRATKVLIWAVTVAATLALVVPLTLLLLGLDVHFHWWN